MNTSENYAYLLDIMGDYLTPDGFTEKALQHIASLDGKTVSCVAALLHRAYIAGMKQATAEHKAV